MNQCTSVFLTFVKWRAENQELEGSLGYMRPYLKKTKGADDGSSVGRLIA